jgi:hypothetical protein
VTEASVGPDVDEPTNILCRLAPQVSFNAESTAVHCLTDLIELSLGQVFDSRIRLQTKSVHDPFCQGRPNTVNVPQRKLYPLVVGYVDTRYSSHD